MRSLRLRIRAVTFLWRRRCWWYRVEGEQPVHAVRALGGVAAPRVSSAEVTDNSEPRLTGVARAATVRQPTAVAFRHVVNSVAKGTRTATRTKAG